MIRRQLYLRALRTRMKDDQSDVRLYVTLELVDESQKYVLIGSD